MEDTKGAQRLTDARRPRAKMVMTVVAGGIMIQDTS